MTSIKPNLEHWI